MTSCLRLTSLVVCGAVSSLAADAAQATFRIISYMNNVYGPPNGITEGSPGLFYFPGVGSPAAAFSTTTQGKKSILGKVTGYFQAPLFSGPDGRFYSATAYSTNPANVVSFGPMQGSEHVFPPQDLAPAITQNQPEGTFLALARSTSTGLQYVAKVDLQGVVTGIYQFPVGEYVLADMTSASDGNYYGAYALSNGSGVVYRVTPSGTFSIVYNFPVNTVSSAPSYTALLLQASDGNLYGTTPAGGLGNGTIYRLTLTGEYTLLYTFPKGPDGIPDALTEGGDGNLYGATLGNGSGNSLLFRITKSGQYTLLYKMANLERDGNCDCRLIQGSDGIFYGTALLGGINGGGAIFALDVGLPAPPPRALKLTPPSGPVGTKVLIWGANLLSASVQFNGVPATTVASSGSNYVWAEVPEGATTGPVTVTTPGGTVTTDHNFTVE